MYRRFQRFETHVQAGHSSSWLVRVVGLLAVAGVVSGLLFGFSATWLRIFTTLLWIMIMLALLVIHHLHYHEATVIMQQLDTCLRLVKQHRVGRQ